MGLFLILILIALAGNVILVVIFGLTTPTAWTFTLTLIVVASAVLGQSVKKRLDGILIDKYNRISLSRFQLICWTILLIGSLACIGIHNFIHGGGGRGALDIDIPPPIWALLGLPAFTAITAAAIKDAKRTEITTASTADMQATNSAVQLREGLSQTPTQDGRVLTKADPTQARWIDMVLGDFEGAPTIDASKFQKLLITLLVLSIYGGDLWYTMSTATGPIAAFPPISAGLLALLGISHAAYLADKQFLQS